MLISYLRPSITWAIGGTAAFVTSAAALTNGRPADVTRISWITGAQTTSSTVVLTGTFGSSISARCAALILPNLATAVPSGVKVTASGKLSGGAVALGGNALTSRTVTLPNGATAIWWVFPAVTIDTLIITIYNDNNTSGSSATWAVASQLVDLGEVWVGKGADFAVKQDIEQTLDGGLLQRRSHNNQAWPLAVQAFRSITANLTPMTETVAIGPNSYQDDFETVLNNLSTANAAVIIPYYLTRGHNSETGQPPALINTSTISLQRLNRSAILGTPDQPIKMQANGDKYYTSPIVFGESPP